MNSKYKENIVAAKFPERRMNPRVDIDGDMQYTLPGSDEVCQGLLENLSLGGARIWVDQELPADSRLTVRVEADTPGEDDLEFKATLLHTLPRQREALYGYGCRLEMPTDWSPERDLFLVPDSKEDE